MGGTFIVLDIDCVSQESMFCKVHDVQSVGVKCLESWYGSLIGYWKSYEAVDLVCC
jgi:hypothetical protein